MTHTTPFGRLDDSAYVNDKAVAELFGVSTKTIWRRTSLGALPRPVRFTNRCTRWRVGDIRAALAAIVNLQGEQQ
jgi:predicted DNA-binding transcriptional regulator AlpA